MSGGWAIPTLVLIQRQGSVRADALFASTLIMEALHELLESETSSCEVLICGIDGWIDAGGAAAQARSLLVAGLSRRTVARFDADVLIDHQARRPVMHLHDGVNTGVQLPEIVLDVASRPGQPSFLLLTGPEPSHRWRQFGREVVDLAERFDVRLVIGLGAYPAPVPHTRQARVVATATSPELAKRVGSIPGELDVPAGPEAVVERECFDRGIPAVGLWAQVPHYVANMPYPAATIALVEALAALTGIEVDVSSLATDVAGTAARIDELVAQNPEHQAMVRQLESIVDQQYFSEQLDSADDLEAELEAFLKQQGESGG